MANWARTFLEQHPELAGRTIRRARHALHFNMGGNQWQGVFVGKPAHWLDGAEWREIDTALVWDSANNRWGAPGIPAYLKADGEVGIIGGTHIQRTTRVGLFRPSNRQFIAVRELPVGLRNDDRLIRETDLWRYEMILLEDGVRQTLTVLERPTISGVRAGDYLVIETAILGRQFPDGWLDEFSADGMYFPLPHCHDSTRHRAPTRRYARTVGGIQYIYTGIPVEWLADAVYPVVIDPDFLAESSDGYISSSYQSWANERLGESGGATLLADSSSSEGWVGEGSDFIQRAYLKFNTSTIGAASTITQVNQTLTPTQIYIYGGHLNIYIIKQDWSGQDPLTSSNDEAAWDGALSSAKDSSIWSNTSTLSANTPKTSGNLSTAWPNKTGSTYYSLVDSLDYDNGAGPLEDESDLGIAASEHGTAGYRPILTVLYEGGEPPPITINLDALTLASSPKASGVVPGAVSKAMDALALAGAAKALDVAPGAVSLAIDALTLLSAAEAVTVTPGAVTLTIQALSLAGIAQALDVTPGAVSRVMAALSLVSATPSASVVATVTLALDALALAGATPALTVTPGAIALAMDALSLAGAAGALDVQPGTVALALSALALAGQAEPLGVTPGAVSLALQALSMAGAPQALAVTPGAVALLLNALALGGQAEALLVTPGTVSLTMQALTLLSEAQALTVTPGAVSLLLDALTLTSTTPSLSIVLAGGIALSRLTLTSATPALAVTPGAVALLLDALTLNAAGKALTVTPGAISLALEALALAGAAQPLTVAPGGVSLLLDALTLAATIPDLDVSPGAVAIALAALDLSGSALDLVVSIAGLTVALNALVLSAAAQPLSVVAGALVISMGRIQLVSAALDVATIITYHLDVDVSDAAVYAVSLSDAALYGAAASDAVVYVVVLADRSRS